jgi:DNA-binding NtrC family response regulator
MAILQGKKILVVEDEAGLAENLQVMLEESGCDLVGVVGTIDSALAFALSSEIDAAVLDIDVQGEESSEIARALQMRGIPYLLATGHATGRSRKFGSAPVLEKPYLQKDLEAALSELLAGEPVG